MADLSQMSLSDGYTFRTHACDAANAAGLPIPLVCAVVEQESSWEPWSIRFELGFYGRYISSMKGLSQTEMYARAFSYGLMQVMGQVAREEGFDGPFLSELLDPPTGLKYGCKKLSREMDKANGSVAAALLGYNGGGNANYPDQVMARMEKYK